MKYVDDPTVPLSAAMTAACVEARSRCETRAPAPSCIPQNDNAMMSTDNGPAQCILQSVMAVRDTSIADVITAPAHVIKYCYVTTDKLSYRVFTTMG